MFVSGSPSGALRKKSLRIQQNFIFPGKEGCLTGGGNIGVTGECIFQGTVTIHGVADCNGF